LLALLGPAVTTRVSTRGALALGGLSAARLAAAREAAQASKATAAILFWIWGGPSQLETWDMKPVAPVESRGPFRPTKTNVSGIEICELFPQLGKLADKYTLIRSLHRKPAHPRYSLNSPLS
jgi:hypothetical protein